MRNQKDSTPFPFAVFTQELLDWLEQFDEPHTASEAEMAGPWRIEPWLAGGHALFAPGDRRDRGDVPAAVFCDLDRARLAAAILPGTGRDALYRLLPAETPQGYAVESCGEVVGHLRLFNPDVTAALHVAECLLRSPEALARLLAAAGGLTLARTGRIFLERVTAAATR